MGFNSAFKGLIQILHNMKTN